MAFKLIEAAQERWRRVNAPHLVALVAAGAFRSLVKNLRYAKKSYQTSRRANLLLAGRRRGGACIVNGKLVERVEEEVAA